MTRDETIIDRLQDLFVARGTHLYLGESVTVAEHMLQCAALAQAQGASDMLIAAALLHDIGHLTGNIDETGDHDEKHEELGASLLEADFPPALSDSVRLHVAAKRYLCASDPAYFGLLSGASRHSLALQGGPMSASEMTMFERLAFHQEALCIRRWDDCGKTPGIRTPSFSEFRPLLCRVLLDRNPGPA